LKFSTAIGAFVVEQLDDHTLLLRGLDLDRALVGPVEVVRVQLQHALLLPAAQLGDLLAAEAVPQVRRLHERRSARVLLAVGVEVDVKEHAGVRHRKRRRRALPCARRNPVDKARRTMLV
jgi:hypothetical protein